LEVKTQSLVTTSTTEAEYINLLRTGAITMALATYKELDINVNPVVLYTDSQNACPNVLNPPSTAPSHSTFLSRYVPLVTTRGRPDRFYGDKPWLSAAS